MSIERKYFARLNADGSLDQGAGWSDIAGSLNGFVSEVKYSDGAAYVGGYFSSPVACMARVLVHRRHAELVLSAGPYDAVPLWKEFSAPDPGCRYVKATYDGGAQDMGGPVNAGVIAREVVFKVKTPDDSSAGAPASLEIGIPGSPAALASISRAQMQVPDAQYNIPVFLTAPAPVQVVATYNQGDAAKGSVEVLVLYSKPN
jgi:hypothetical protein